jgi:hypothetical protein
VLLTRSPLITGASSGSPFDLHVLSTPPAFVLSQDQTLRECLMRTGRSPVTLLESLLLSQQIAGSHELTCSNVPKKSSRNTTEIESRRRGNAIYGTNFRHAVEFSRSGRAPSQAFRPDPGQPMKRYSVRFAVSNSPWSSRARQCHSNLSCCGLWRPARPAPDPGSVRRAGKTLAER